MKFTDAKIRRTKPAKDRQIFWESWVNGCGFGIRVFPSGTRSFIFAYRFNGKSRMWTVGKYPQTELATARRMAAEGKEKLIQGIDPGTKAVTAKRAYRDAPIIEALVHEYIEKWAKVRKRSWKEDHRILQKDVIPLWGNRKAKDITRRDVVSLLDVIVERGAEVQANRVLAVVRKMFNFAIERSIITANPCVAIRAPGKETRRDRVLSEDEIQSFWVGLEKTKMMEPIKLALKLQLVTAQRKGESIGAEWQEVDLSKGWWTIPAEKFKNRLAHRVPLSPLALKILGEVKSLSNGSSFLFPSVKNMGHIDSHSVDQAVNRNRNVLQISDFRPHDLRRTAASMMTSAGIPRLIVSKILNHAEPNVTAVYDRHSYDNEKREALETWGRKLESILTGEKGKVLLFASFCQ